MYCVFGLCIVAISNVDPVPAAHRPVPAPRRPVPASRGTFKNPFYGKSNDFAQLLDKKLEQEEQENSGFAISKIVFIQCSKSNQYLLPTVTQIFRETKVGNIKGLKTTIFNTLARLRRPPAAFFLNGAITRPANGTKSFLGSSLSHMQSSIKIGVPVLEI